VSSAAADWLMQHAEGVPAALHARMLEAVRASASAVDASAVTTARQLAEAAVHCLRAALDQGDERSAALSLLAADALITSACEAAAADGPGALADLCADYAPERLAAEVPA
jgi:hypothetical protein